MSKATQPSSVSPITRSAMLAIGGLACLLPSTAMAQDVDWSCSEGGSFEDTSCWSSGMVPTSGENIRFDLGATYQVILPDTGFGYQDVAGMSVIGDDVTFDIQNIYRYFYTDSFLDIDNSSAARSNQTAFRIRNGDVYTMSLSLVNGTLDIGPYSSVSADNLSLTGNSIINVQIGNVDWSPAVSLYNSPPGTIDLAGSLVVSVADNQPDPPLGVTRTLFETNWDGSLVINDPFPAVFTNPPVGREFVITGNEQGSTEITAELIFADTYTDDEFSEPDVISEEAVAVVTGDLSNNGLDDILLVMPDNRILVYESTASGNTLGPYEYGVGNDPVDAEIGDYDGNGFNDIVVLNQSDSTCSVFYNPTGDPSALEFFSDYSTPDTPTAVVNCDLGEGESKGFQQVAARDIVIVSKGGGGRASGYRGSAGSGLVLVASIIIEEEPETADPAEDEDKKDEDDDIVVGHTGAAAGFASGTGSPSLSVIRAQRDGSLSIIQQNIPVSSTPNQTAAISINGNDFIAVGTEGGTIDLYERSASSSSFIFYSSNQVGDSVRSIGASDLDGDGRMDIVASVGNSDDANLALFLNRTGGGASVIDFQSAGQVEFNDPTGRLAVGVLFDDGGQRFNGVTGTTAPESGGDASLFSGFYFEADTPDCVAADFDSNGTVDGTELGQLMAAWGLCPGCPEDLNGDGVVDGADMGLLFNVWGPCTE